MNKSTIIKDIKIPEQINHVLKTLNENHFEGYLVGGCIRDILMHKEPKDWDITTNAKPEQIQGLFPDSFYENDYGTVGVKTEIGVVEITPYRKEGSYSDGRRPDTVEYTEDIVADLSRRDFTINAIAYDPLNDSLVDPYHGIEDIKAKSIKCVGDANKRFAEDGLRIMRMIRFSAQLDFSIDSPTLVSAMENKEILNKIAKERIKDEFCKILMSQNAIKAFIYMSKVDVLQYITIHLKESVNVKQNGCHAYDVFEHLIRSLQCAVDKNYPLEIRLAALFHDIGKPSTRVFSKEKNDYTFYNHEVVGTKMTKKILTDLKFSHETIDKVTKLIRWHMFFSDTDQITHSAVRRMISNVGRENIWDLINLRICDRVGTGRPKEDPYRLRKYMSIIEEVLSDATDVSMLKISGQDLIDMLHVTPGPIIGQILNILLDKCIENPKINTKEELLNISKELLHMKPEELTGLYEKALALKKQENDERVHKIRSKYKVR
jgi:poly(A) polymerase/tRNA nucleotidyltransferase (CCA-adding enzyme)